ncbi:trehalose-phosphatase [Roseateles amylovorans]|uniref:Trehalose 6-phosphate phosphatase n=1 Tax=Roseateles amylovorans TaxID=2978473 RepID=A0ABY6B705_9BURK|nr:trehalose-phosphatase [Roseateles amylovorans]UXH80546.1 trehalose-phosphatase [Roseateles amylovorans]
MPVRHLLGRDGTQALTQLMQQQPLLAFDFDGTLAPIVMHPDEARVPVEVARQLEHLARRVPVAVITGRQVLDVRHRLGFAPTHIVGNHGAEDEFDGPDPGVVLTLKPFRERADRFEPLLSRVGASIEDKGASIAIHYRLAANPVEARAAIDELLSDLPAGVITEPGKRVVNVLVAGAPDKGDALARLCARYGTSAAFYAGDDTNDEPAFRRAAPGWVTARVGPRLDHSHAGFFLQEQAEMDEALRVMRQALGD